MFCKTCGSDIEVDAKFCGECGAVVTADEVEESQPNVRRDALSSSSQESDAGKAYVQEIFHFVMDSLKSPLKTSREVSSKYLVSGLFIHLLFALLLPLFVYFTARSLNETYFFWMGNIPFTSVVVTPFIVIVIYLAVYIAVILAVSRIMKVTISYLEILVRLSVFHVIPVTLLFFAILFTFISATTFSFILCGAAIGLFFASSYFILFSIKEDSAVGLDVYYGLILVNIAVSIIFFIIGDSFMGNFIDRIQEEVMYRMF